MLAFILLTPALSAAQSATFSGDSRTMVRLRESTNDNKRYPLYEYLNLGGEMAARQGVLSLNFGGWGRFDLGDKSTSERTNNALQSGFVSYRGDNNNLKFQAGRQFIAEGVATERLDGIYLHNDFAGGFAGSAYVGAPVVTQADLPGGDITYGGRIAHSMPKYYTIGVSTLWTEDNSNRIRQEEGIDLWFHPLAKLDLVGRSSYNSLTSGWMEHAYSLKYAPLDRLVINAAMSGINYRDYFHQVTTNALSLTTGVLDPREKVLTLGGSINYITADSLNISADYKNYDYDIAGAANYYGAKAAFFLPESFMAGLSYHRMDGENDRLRFDEYRVFASKKLGKVDVTADFFDVHYDNAINDISNTYSVAASVAFEITGQLKVAADIDYGKTVDFDRQVSGLVKLIYRFDTQKSTEGGVKSEK